MIRFRNFIFFICLSGGLAWVCMGAAQNYLRQEKFMALQEIKKRWGDAPFSPNAFKTAAVNVRAKMAHDLIRRKALVGKSASEIKALLGPTSGYFWSERVPTYFIEEGWSQKKDSWQLVFLIDANERVTEVRVHRNCCEKGD